MKKSESWSATPYNYSKPVEKSRTGSGELKDNGTRKWSGPTPSGYFKPVEKSGAEGMGDPKGTTGDRMERAATPMSFFSPVPKSMPDVPVQPKSWKQKGYTQTGPVTQDFGDPEKVGPMRKRPNKK